MLTPEQIQSYRQKYKINPIYAPTPMNQGGVNLGIKDAFTGSVDYAKQGYEQARNAKNPLELFRGSLKLGAGTIGAAFSPLAPVMKPIEKGVGFASEKISDIPAVQKFAQSEAGQKTARVAEDVQNIAGIAAGVAGGPGLGKGIIKTGQMAGKTVKPAIAGTGRVLKEAGEASYGTTITASEGTNRAMASYKESTPNLAARIKNTVKGTTEGKPITETETAGRYGLIGTEKEIGVQAGRFMEKTWKEKVQPALAKNKGKLDMNKFWGTLEKKIRTENPELTRRNALLEGLNDLKSEYSKVSKVGLEKLQNYKEGWTKFQSEQVWKGKPIASATKETMKMAGDEARNFIYKNTPPEVRQAYIDYGNLKSIKEAGIKSGVGDPAKKSISRGAWQFVMDKAVTPVATTMGKILYRTGEGLEFVGEAGAKKVGDIIGDKPNPQSGMVKNPFADNQIKNDLNNYDPLPVNTNKGLQFGNTDANFRISQLKDKMKTKSLSESEYKELKTLLQQVGGTK